MGADPLHARAVAFTRAARESVCDVREPWEHGTILRATRFASWWDRNVVRVEERLEGLEAAELAAMADRALSGLCHRLICFEDVEAGEPYRRELERRGYRTTRLVWMHHEGPRPAVVDGVAEVPCEEVEHLRVAWHREDFPGSDPAEFQALMREHALAHGARALASLDRGGRPVGFATLDPVGGQAEVGAVYVLPEHRGAGRGTALIRAAIAAARDYDHVWICAGADDRPQHLYARLGFRPALRTIEFLRPG